MKISSRSDPAEIEAGQIAERITRLPPGESPPIKPLRSAQAISSQHPGHVQNAMRSAGQPLDRSTRIFFEPRLGYDLSSVRIHHDSSAGQSARAIDAKAYNVGNEIVFGHGEYRPHSESGDLLLAHELAHVAQRGSSIIDGRTIYRQPSGDTQAELRNIESQMMMIHQQLMMPVNPMRPMLMAQLQQLEQRRHILAGPGAGSSTSGPTTPEFRLKKAKELLNKTESGQATLHWLAGFRKNPSALSASLEASEIGVEFRPNEEAHYDRKNRKIILNDQETTQMMALSLLQLRHLTIYDPDPLKLNRDPYLDLSISALASGAIDQIEFKREIQASGISFDTAIPLEAQYAAVYNKTYAAALPGDATRTWKDVGPDAKSQAGIEARRVVYEAIQNNAPTLAGTKKQQADSFGKDWDQERAAQAKQDQANAEKSRAEAERQAKIDGLITALAEVVNKTKPDSPEEEKIVQLVSSVTSLMSLPDTFSFINKANDGLDRLLGPFGYRSVMGVSVGGLQSDRLDYGLGNFLAMKPKDRARLRAELRVNPFAAQKRGIQLFPTDAERRAEGQLVAVRTLPDGTLHVGSLDEFHEAEEQNRINHALAQIDAIANAGPGALIGRIVGGERGAEIGGMIDTGLMVLAPMKARGQIRSQMSTMKGGGTGLPRPQIELMHNPEPAPPTPDRVETVEGGNQMEQSAPAPALEKTAVRDGPMRRPPGRGNRAGMTTTSGTQTPHQQSNPAVEVLPRSTVPMKDFEPPEPGHYIRRKPPDKSIQAQIIANAGRTTDGRLRDANTGRALNEGEAVFGHAPHSQFAPTRNEAEKHGWTQEQFDQYFLDPAMWQIEYGPSNSSRVFDKISRQKPVH